MEEIGLEPEHGRHVARLALVLFDGLAPLHGLGLRERHLLHAGALVHDVGMSVADRGHHKRSYHLIARHSFRHWKSREVGFVALLARYHRKAAPNIKHGKYSALPRRDREAILRLSAILRLADGLDSAHLSTVQGIDVSCEGETVRLRLRAERDCGAEIWGAERKADLFESVFSRRLCIEAANGRRPTENRALEEGGNYPHVEQLA